MTDIETRPAVRPDGARALQLMVISAEGVETHILPASGVITLGRLEANDVTLRDASISRRHASIEIGVSLHVTDLESANGVTVRGQRIRAGEAAQFAVSEPIELGSVTIVVQPFVQRLVAQAPGGARASAIVAEHASMRNVFALVSRVANSPMTVLITGETGVGKEVVAEALHRESSRRDGPFVRLNCGAVAPSLLESELFGHEKGAFSGADAAKSGLIESADGGTMFLDEVGELPLALQVKLLRVLEDRAVLRVGSVKPRAVDVRFVAATNRDLESESEKGTFRRDLYYRLNGITIEIPPLRDRVSEIAPLARTFLTTAAARTGRSVPSLSPEAVARLEAHAWPGNVRELRNAMERAVLLADSPTIAIEHLPPQIVRSDSRGTSSASPEPTKNALRGEIEALERARILDALEKCQGHQTRAAAMLGMPRRTFVAKLDLYGVPRPRKKSTASDDD